MIFCKHCKNYMQIQEIDMESKRSIYYSCIPCNYFQSTDEFNIFTKSYKKSNKKDWIRNPEFAVADNTLPKKSTKCPDCKKINENVYYQNPDLTITLICKNCTKLWIYS